MESESLRLQLISEYGRGGTDGRDDAEGLVVEQ